MKKAWMSTLSLFLIITLSLSASGTARASDMAGPEQAKEPEGELEELRVEQVTLSRISSAALVVEWLPVEQAAAYVVLRQSPGDSEWEARGIAGADETDYYDVFPTSEPRQYIYRVDAVPSDTRHFKTAPGDTAFISNILICLDPGHYKGSSGACEDDGLVYEECTFVLDVGLKVRDILRDRYGITCRMTRENDVIDLFGKQNSKSPVEDRGIYAEGCDLFVSLHTNANGSGVNGYREWYQPLYMNKPMVILNSLACDNAVVVSMANGIGMGLAHANYELGIAENETFATMETGAVTEWFDWKDDDPSTAGLVCRRTGKAGDYYGVLRGSNSVGVPGMIIEHGYHTVLEMRRLANTGVLAPIWAEIDAVNIAAAYGFTDLSGTETDVAS